MTAEPQSTLVVGKSDQIGTQLAKVPLTDIVRGLTGRWARIETGGQCGIAVAEVFSATRMTGETGSLRK